MKTESREFYYDEDLKLEAYQFKGIMQPFPNHFHEYYVIGFIEKGNRHLLCKNKEYILKQGALLLFNPGDNHGCAPIDQELLDYRALNIPPETMHVLCHDIIKIDKLPLFHTNVVYDEQAVYNLQMVFDRIVEGSKEFEKEELLMLLISYLLQNYSEPFSVNEKDYPQEVELVCEYIEKHSHEHINLKQLCEYSSMSTSTLLRSFTKEKGITPYRYLEIKRLHKAKLLLEKGHHIVDAALQTGFCDQSHFSKFFQIYFGISPGAYREIFTREVGNEQ